MGLTKSDMVRGSTIAAPATSIEQTQYAVGQRVGAVEGILDALAQTAVGGIAEPAAGVPQTGSAQWPDHTGVAPAMRATMKRRRSTTGGGSESLEQQGFDVAYLTELDPLWKDDELTRLLNPDVYLFGNLPWIKGNLSLVILGTIALSLLPLVVAGIRARLAGAKA